jgi:hypothetical protein
VWTASELRPLHRHGWRIANHFALGRSDIDHVLIGPGGVIAVETKWSASGWILDPPEPKLQHALEQVRRNAKNIKYWHDLKAAGLTDVESVLFLWGYDDDSVGTRRSRPVVIDGTTVVSGTTAAETWRTQLKSAPATATPEQADHYWRAIDARIRTRDADDTLREPPLPSLSSIYWQATCTLVAALAAVYAFAETFRLRPAPLAIAGLAGLGVVARRIHQTRIIALGWLTALAACLTAFSVLEVAYHL